MSDAFVHLHVHSEFTMLDSTLKVPDLVAQAQALEMPAVALTDLNNMFGALGFHRACQKAGVAPIVGAELSVWPGEAGQDAPRHVTVLAESQGGYHNLVRLVSQAWTGADDKQGPALTRAQLRQRSEGLVLLTGCLGGMLAQEVLQHGKARGQALLEALQADWPRGALFVELQDHGLPEQATLNTLLVEIADTCQLPYVATGNCHYLRAEDAPAHLALQCIGTGESLSARQSARHSSTELYLKSAAQMAERFARFPAALTNTLVVAERCGGKVEPLAAPKLPRFQLPAGEDEASHLRQLAARGLEARMQQSEALGRTVDRSAYAKRLDRELDVIIDMGFPGYFLVVQDFINWSKQQGIPVGPGRGSGAGSLVAWSLNITDLDPIPYGLLFERFLNPERVSMPDFDIDFCMDRRDEVIDYVRQRYGTESVGQIATFHQLKSRSVVRDVGRVLGKHPSEAGRLATLVPEPVQGKSVSIPDALKQEPRLKAVYEGDAETKRWLSVAIQLEDLTRHAGMHAAGVVISEGPLWDHVPIFCPEPGTYVTQYHKDDVEAAGLVKFDFLGLKTLTVIARTVELIGQRPDRDGQPFDLAALPLDDKATFALLQSGETTNVFQLESSGMQKLFKQLKPDCFEDIVAAVALYRPGPLGSGMVEDFVQRKHGRVPVAYPHPALEPILKDTYGVIVYQEQVMQIAREMAGYSLGGADLLRRAMGKKKAEEMAKQKVSFLEGAVRQGFSERDADRVFELMAYFAGYGFNKSHSAAYALITYQTAFLKAHFPVEFMCAALSTDKDKSDKVVRSIAEARSMGLTVLPPDINESAIDFSVVYAAPVDAGKAATPSDRPRALGGRLRDPLRPKIRFGLGAIKGVGSAALASILAARQPEGEAPQPFEDLFDCAARVDMRPVNKNVFEALVQCGAFDAVHAPAGVHRAQALAAVDLALERGKRSQAERASGQTSLFGLIDAHSDAGTSKALRGDFPQLPCWAPQDELMREKATLGFFVSGHPLDRFQRALAHVA
ncbi:MAG: DNA polymerase III subunit alpha, partial [Polyangiales bacterium]